ncbi:MAG TPA: rod shape-determining protein MreC [bacterium]|nr:rod shape-determining protein MreC [bacterium]
MNHSAPFRDYAWLGLFIAVTLALLLLSPDAAAVRRHAHDAAAPLLAIPRAAGTLIGTGGRGWQRWQADRQALAAAQAECGQLRRRLAALELRAPAPAADAGIALPAAQVIGAEAQPWPSALVIDRGAADGVVAMQGVAAWHDNRLVCIGRIGAVYHRTALLIPLNHPACKLPARLDRGPRGLILSGAADAGCRLEYARPEITLAAGDSIVTAGDGNLLPPDLPLGRISAIAPRSGPFQSVTVIPYCDPYTVEQVYLLPAPGGQS